MLPLVSRRVAALKGTASLPGDKSISHRALILGALCIGATRLRGLSAGADVMNTCRALEQLGVGWTRDGSDDMVLHGVGTGGLAEPDNIIDLGNSGTSARLLAGVVATHPITAVFTGDHSLRRRPMERVFTPLSLMGARFDSRPGDLLPATIHGTEQPIPIEYILPVASAQVKSAVLLAGLNTPGQTRVIEQWPTRDHTERLLNYLGATIDCTESEQGFVISVAGEADLRAADIAIPRDPSAAAFIAAAACLVPDSEVFLPDIGINPLRMGFFDILREMGASIEIANQRLVCGEPWADMRVRGSSLTGCRVTADRAATMIDEYPILACVAACAQGETRFEGVGELRYKESDRFSGLIEGLRGCGVDAEAEADSILIEGSGDPPPGGGLVSSRLDHRMAMAFLILGLVSRQPITIDDSSPVATSFPGFAATINQLGGAIADA